MCALPFNSFENDSPNVCFTLFVLWKNVQKVWISFEFLQKMLKNSNFLSIFIKNVQKVRLFLALFLKNGLKNPIFLDIFQKIMRKTWFSRQIFSKKVEKVGFFKRASRKNTTFYQIFCKADVQMSALPHKTLENDGPNVCIFPRSLLVKGVQMTALLFNSFKNDDPNVPFTLFVLRKNVQKVIIFAKNVENVQIFTKFLKLK